MPISKDNPSLPLTNGMFDTLFGEGRIGLFANKDLSALSGTCKALNNELNPELAKRKLLQHIVYGEQDEAEAILKASPALLLVKSQAIDYSGRTIIGTPFQAALGAEDERMWAMMKPYFNELESQGDIESAQEEMKTQFDEQFPDGIKSTSYLELQLDYNELANAILNDKDNGDAAIEAFRKKIIERKEVTSGKHFNMQHLIAAYLAYTNNYDALDIWWKNKGKYWQKVIGYVQRQMPANYAQAHCSGIKNVLDDANNFNRTFDLCDSRKFFPLRSSDGLGFNFGVSSSRSCYSAAQGEDFIGWFVGDYKAFANYVDQKQDHLSFLEQGLNPDIQESRGFVRG